MNLKTSRFARRGAGTIAIAAIVVLAAGCSGSKDEFAKVNGQVITQQEYLQTLEQAPVNPTGGMAASGMTGAQFALDQLVGNKVLTAQASKEGVLPTDADVNARYELQKKIFAQQMPGKSFEEVMAERGATPEMIKTALRAQLTESNLLAKKLKITDADLQKSFDGSPERPGLKDQFRLGERVQIRVIVVPAKGAQFDEAQKMLASKVDFAEVAKKVNPAALKTDGGLMPQALPIEQAPPAWQPKMKETAAGSYFGPVDWPSAPTEPGQKAWVKIDSKLPAFELKFDEAKPLVKQQVVQERLSDPAAQQVRAELSKMKLDAALETDDSKYKAIWSALKKNAESAAAAAESGGMPPAGG